MVVRASSSHFVEAGASSPDCCAIGTAKGPGDLPYQYTLITPDHDGQVKIGEFVYYVLPTSAYRQKPILGRVVKRTPVRLFPDSFMASPDVPPLEVAAAMGYTDEEDELFEITVTVMGYFDQELGSFVNPRVLPRSGTPIYLAPSEMLSAVLSRRQLGQRGSAYVGSLLSRDVGAVPVVLDVNEFTSTHLSIIAGTGAGKSYLAGVIVEELLRPYNRGCVLIADPHGEYDTLLDITNLKDFVDGDYRPRVRVFKPEQVKVRFSTLTLDDIRYLLPTMGERMEWILTEAFDRVHRPRSNSITDRHYTRSDLLNAINDIGRESLERGSDYMSSVHGLIWRFERQFMRSFTFADYDHLPLNQLFQPGQCTVLQLNEIDQRDQQVVIATLLRRLLKARMDTEKHKLQESDESFLPYPVFVLLEEAHHFAPASADVVSSNVLKQVLAEGRKFGVGIGLISQRPGKLDADVLSQCMTHVIMRIVNPIDQNSVASAIESVGRDLLDELPALSKGQAVIAGTALNSPVLCQTRARLTRHGGTSLAAAEEWAKYFAHRNHLERDESIVAHRTVGRHDLFR
jgi:DNA helicase HerA-like ATPase